MSGQTIRSFIAVDLPPEVRREAARLAERLAAGVYGVKWVEPKNLHLTVKFLGGVEPETLDRVERAVATVTAGFSPVELRLAGAGSFPPRGRPRVIWLGVHGHLDRLAGLAAAIETALEPLGFEPEGRPFSPHLTLGRVKKTRKSRSGPGTDLDAGLLRGRIMDLAEAQAGIFVVRELVLFQSDLSPAGPTYTPLARFPLTDT
ncbi:MAG: RNA 2',3'-cyclic phosphodiesterase [Proteobacteria bacterium]|nr:RNA 2',3'-cyclic phosphodiesterase [Pseudomonadota bacterium]